MKLQNERIAPAIGAKAQEPLPVIGRKASGLALLTGILFGLHSHPAPATAADLGGDCCADLEERISELEATTVRRTGKVSVTLTGHVAKQMMFWDDGEDGGAYVTDLGPTQASNFRITGQVKFARDWTAGYMIRIQDLTNNTIGLSQFVNADDQGLNVQMSNWFVASESYGKLTVGKQALASKSAVMFTDLSGTQLIASYVLFDGGGFFLRQNGTLSPVRWGDLGYCYSQQRRWGGDCDGIVMTGVRYDTPVFKGLSFSASYGEDSDWEVAGRYNANMAGFKIALGIGYSVNDDVTIQPPPISLDKHSQYFQAGGYAEHLATGLFLYGAYGEEDNNARIFSGIEEPDSHHWYVKGGIRRPWTSHGATILWGEYGQYLDQMGPAALNAGVTDSEFTRWGLGVAQEFDKAALTLWIKFREHEGEVAGGALAGDLDSFRYVTTGGIINF